MLSSLIKKVLSVVFDLGTSVLEESDAAIFSIENGGSMLVP